MFNAELDKYKINIIYNLNSLKRFLQIYIQFIDIVASRNWRKVGNGVS